MVHVSYFLFSISEFHTRQALHCREMCQRARLSPSFFCGGFCGPNGKPDEFAETLLRR
ncbi:hypothetical protein BDV24DRAFT_121117 [Aspergillus arachidicola]|uniref:Uncharacterized protein n=1 Tax=Aspergillus arachidicola TaxID=656916 RepID=A0A5N6YR08_9EURO|nr:hypothetical protein BDV24DRAFT_121117 [Aspergillus arachidicola]